MSDTLDKLRQQQALEDHVKRQRATLVSCPDCRLTMETTTPPEPPGVVVEFRSKSGEKRYAMRLVVSRAELENARGYDPILEAKRRVRREQGAAEACRCSGTGLVLQSLVTDESDDLPARARRLDAHEARVRAKIAAQIREMAKEREIESGKGAHLGEPTFENDELVALADKIEREAPL